MLKGASDDGGLILPARGQAALLETKVFTTQKATRPAHKYIIRGQGPVGEQGGNKLKLVYCKITARLQDRT